MQWGSRSNVVLKVASGFRPSDASLCSNLLSSSSSIWSFADARSTSSETRLAASSRLACNGPMSASKG